MAQKSTRTDTKSFRMDGFKPNIPKVSFSVPIPQLPPPPPINSFIADHCPVDHNGNLIRSNETRNATNGQFKPNYNMITDYTKTY